MTLVFAALMLCTAGIVTATPNQQATPTIVLDPTSASVAGCDVVEVAIRIEAVADLYGADVRLTFDPDVVQVVDADDGAPGEQITPGGFLAPPLITVKNEVDNTLGTIWYAATQLDPTPPASGSGTLAIIRFRAREPGTSAVSFTYHRLANRDGEVIGSDVEDGTVEATGPGCIRVWPDDAAIDGCEEIDVEIQIGNITDLYGADVRLSFNPSIVEVVDSDPDKVGVQIEIGDLLVPPLIVTRNEAHNDAGTIWFAATQLNPTPPVNGAGVLAIVHLRAVGAGTSALTFTYTKMGDIDGNEIPATATGGTVTTTGLAAPSALTIAKLNPTTARLTWGTVSGVGEYHVYRDTYAYFTPGSTPYATTTSQTYDDVGALGSSVQNYFYVVRSACGAGLVESPISNRVGEFDFDLYRGASPGLRKYTLIGYPLFHAAVPNADALARYIDPLLPSVYQLLRYDNLTQNIEYWLPYVGPSGHGTNFPTVVGEPYYVWLESYGPTLVTFAGDVPALGSVSFALNRPGPETCRYNHITVPLDRIDLTTADQLAADIGGVYAVMMYDGLTQDVAVRLPPPIDYGPNFTVRVGYPYIVCATAAAPATWP